LNIWIVSAYDPVPGFDTDIRVIRYGSLTESLLAAGHQVIFWTSTFAHWRKRARFTENTQRRVGPNLTAEFLHAPAYSRNVSLARIRHNRRLARAFTKRSAQLPVPDLVVAEIPCLELAEAAAQFARPRGVPFVCDIQDIWPDVYLTAIPRWLHAPARLLLQGEYRRLRRILAAATSVTAVSRSYLEWTRPWLHRPLGATDAAFPLGYARPPAEILAAARERMPAFRQRLQLGDDEIRVVFLGQFATSYDVDTVVEAALLLEQDPALPRFRVLLAGNGAKEERLRRKAAGSRAVVFTGWLEHAETICLLQSAHLALAAYAPNAAQSLPYKPFEYMAFGLPIINSLPGELAELVATQGLGLNYDAGVPSSLAASIRSLLVDPEKRAACARHAARLYESTYSSSAIYGQMARFVTTLVRTDPANP
jgi:glycosyltransferase involved in cell wall biosynthesis